MRNGDWGVNMDWGLEILDGDWDWGCWMRIGGWGFGLKIGLIS